MCFVVIAQSFGCAADMVVAAAKDKGWSASASHTGLIRIGTATHDGIPMEGKVPKLWDLFSCFLLHYLSLFAVGEVTPHNLIVRQRRQWAD